MNHDTVTTPNTTSPPVAVLARIATTGIYLLQGIPRELQRSARTRAMSEGTTLRGVLFQALREYAAGTWTPGPHGDSPKADDRRPS